MALLDEQGVQHNVAEPAVFTENQVYFKIDNRTDYVMEPQGCFADFGDFSQGPLTVSSW